MAPPSEPPPGPPQPPHAEEYEEGEPESEFDNDISALKNNLIGISEKTAEMGSKVR